MTRRTTHLVLCLIMAVCISACDGGLVGTSTGPKIVPTDVPRLPKKISPQLPKTIKGSNNTTPQNVTTVTSGSNADAQTESKSWSLISPSMQQIDTTRIAVQEILTLLDNEFESILYECIPALTESDTCTFAPGEIATIYTDDVTQKMIAIHLTANADTPPETITEDTTTSELRAYYTSLEGTSVVFNELTLFLPDTPTNEFQLLASTDDLLQGDQLLLSWNATYDQITYQVSNSSQVNQTERYNYRNNASGQRLTVQRDLLDTEGAPGTHSFEFTTQPVDTGEVFYSARIDDYYISGQAGEESAYAYTRDFDTAENGYSNEVFNEDGTLIAFYECSDETNFTCDETEFDDDLYELYISPEDLDIAEMDLGFSDVSINGLPSQVEEFLILEDTPGIPLWLRDEFCEGWQPIAGEVELFCFVPDNELEDSVVVSADGEDLVLLPTAQVILE